MVLGKAGSKGCLPGQVRGSSETLLASRGDISSLWHPRRLPGAPSEPVLTCALQQSQEQLVLSIWKEEGEGRRLSRDSRGGGRSRPAVQGLWALTDAVGLELCSGITMHAG